MRKCASTGSEKRRSSKKERANEANHKRSERCRMNMERRSIDAMRKRKERNNQRHASESSVIEVPSLMHNVVPQDVVTAELLLFKSSGMIKPSLERCLEQGEAFVADKFNKMMGETRVLACAACGILFVSTRPKEFHGYAVDVVALFKVPERSLREHSSRGVYGHQTWLSLLKGHVSKDHRNFFSLATYAQRQFTKEHLCQRGAWILEMILASLSYRQLRKRQSLLCAYTR